MELFLQNTRSGLVPLYDEDYEEKKKLKIGEVYKVTIKRPRNYRFHKLYFALINCAWEYQNEAVVNHFKTVESFRKTVEISAGHFDEVFLIDKKEWVQTSKSIAFVKMDEDEFKDLYERVKDVLFSVFLKNITQEEFERNLINF